MPATTDDAQFDIFCNTGFNGGNFMTFYSPSLITCINGCATFNYWQIMNGNIGTMNCSGVKYGLNLLLEERRLSDGYISWCKYDLCETERMNCY